MLNTIRQRFRDMRTISALCSGAEKLANATGQKEPATEHLVLSALELPDGTARKAFERIQADPNGFRAAIAKQYQDALHNIGISLPPDIAIDDKTNPVATGKGLFKSQASFKSLMQTLYEVKNEEQKMDSTAPLLGAHVILAATTAQYGVAVRAFRAMGVDPAKLAEAAKAEIMASRVA